MPRQRKELSHAQLLTEIISQLANQFKPEVPMVKRQIDDLIGRDYMERVEDAAVPTYRYIA